MVTHFITLVSLHLFWIPLVIAWYQEDCQGYVAGIAIVLAAGFLNHGLDNFFYGRIPKTGKKNFAVFLTSTFDRVVSVGTIIYFAVVSFAVSIKWLFSLICIVIAGVIYMTKTDQKYGHIWHVNVHSFAALAMTLSIYACKENPACAYCGPEPRLSTDLFLQKV